MRITTWNVNGLRAVLGKGILEGIQPLNADVLCLQEIKARPEQLDKAHLEAIAAAYPSLLEPRPAPRLQRHRHLGQNRPRFHHPRPGRARI